VSGGGDAELFVWDWQNYQLVKRLPIRDVALQHLKSRPELLPSVVDDATFKTAVSGIWEAPSNNNEVRNYP
jgi:tRNA (guanine-N(7)-)-methyltransferase subunit TRM82